MGVSTCARCCWWAGECSHPRHANGDPETPCGLYRYRNAPAVGKGEPKMRCGTCKRDRPRAEFERGNGEYWKQCAQCRAKARARIGCNRKDGR